MKTLEHVTNAETIIETNYPKLKIGMKSQKNKNHCKNALKNKNANALKNKNANANYKRI